MLDKNDFILNPVAAQYLEAPLEFSDNNEKLCKSLRVKKNTNLPMRCMGALRALKQSWILSFTQNNQNNVGFGQNWSNSRKHYGKRDSFLHIKGIKSKLGRNGTFSHSDHDKITIMNRTELTSHFESHIWMWSYLQSLLNHCFHVNNNFIGSIVSSVFWTFLLYVYPFPVPAVPLS